MNQQYGNYISHNATMSLERIWPLISKQIIGTCKQFSLGEPCGVLTIRLNDPHEFRDPEQGPSIQAFISTWILEIP